MALLPARLVPGRRRSASAPLRRRRGRAGFTLIELMVVTLLIGIALSVAFIRLDTLIPSSRLDKAARDLGTMLVKVRDMAILAGREYFVEYDLEGERYKFYRPATQAEEDDGADEIVESDWYDLPKDIRIENVRYSDGDAEDRGTVTLRFSPTGELEGHLVNLLSVEILDEKRSRYAVELNSITGLVSYTLGGKLYEPLRTESDFR